jgi:2-iminobutanoate/2-iminopropanoate deaminase
MVRLVRHFPPLALAGVLALASTLGAAERSYVGQRGPADASQPPFSRAVRIGDTVYLAGHIGRDSDGKVPSDPADEARLVMDAFKATLAEAGLVMDDLVSVQVFCADVSLYDTFNGVYRRYFTNAYPARAFIGSGPLLFGARFEVVGVAVKR